MEGWGAKKKQNEQESLRWAYGDGGAVVLETLDQVGRVGGCQVFGWRRGGHDDDDFLTRDGNI